ncbi:MAG TPA: hypothetical protein VFY89_03475 [Ktedonobacterales bacterium]
MFYHLPRMRRHAGALVILLAMSAVVAACGPSGVTSTPSPTPTPPAASPTAASTPTATPVPRVLFQADWTPGLAGWQATSGWSVVGGALVSDTGQDRAFTIPFRPAGPDYTIEFELRITSVPVDGEGKFFLEAPATPGRDGFIAGGYHLLTNNIHVVHNHPLFGITIDPPGDNQSTSPVPFRDYEHEFNQHVYRVEVRGSAATFMIDGRDWIATRSISTPTLSTGPLHFTCSYVVLRLSALRILSA